MPVALEHDFRPAGQIDVVLLPFDPLRAARRDDLRLPRGAAERGCRNQRRTRSGAGRQCRADASLPNHDSHAIGCFNRRELDIRPFREHLMPLQRGAETLEATGGG